MKYPARSYFIIFTITAVSATVLLSVYAESVAERFGKTQAGINLRRLDNETIRISWGTGSGVNVSPEGTLTFRGFKLESGTELPPLFPRNGVWMYALEPERMGETVPASFVNPKLDGAVERMFHMIALGRDGNRNTDTLTRKAAQSYAYLGYVVMNDEDVAALKFAMEDRAGLNLDEDIKTPERRLYKLRHGVERHFVEDPDNEKALVDVRKRIPVMFESINLEAGHPGDVMHVLYLDGHVEAIPFGERFPALSSFMKAFPPPSATE